MVYKHLKDIDESKELYVDKLNATITNIVRAGEKVFQLPNVHPDLSIIMSELLRAFLFTHKSIIILLTPADGDLRLGVDAMSLVREQIEKIFVISLLLDNPSKWTEVYIKSSWKKDYEGFLLEKQECQHLPRFDQYFKEAEQKLIFMLDQYSSNSTLERQAVEFEFNNPGVRLPLRLKAARIEEFPTPGKAKAEITDPKVKDFLNRWHKEYKFKCAYSHIGLSKLVFHRLIREKNVFPLEKINIYYEKQIKPCVIMSFVAIASACTEILKVVNDISLIAELSILWETLKECSMIGKVFWEIRAKDLLPPSIV